jgi:uncharacterized membrane protein
MLRAMRRDEGSTIPLILGLFLIALILVAGSVAAGDAFVQQRTLQDVCDGAAIAAASSADLDNGRHDSGNRGEFLDLTGVQTAVDRYRSRDAFRQQVEMAASVGNDQQTATVECVQTRTVAFGSWFGYGSGITHRVTSTARAPLQPN